MFAGSFDSMINRPANQIFVAVGRNVSGPPEYSGVIEYTPSFSPRAP